MTAVLTLKSQSRFSSLKAAAVVVWFNLTASEISNALSILSMFKVSCIIDNSESPAFDVGHNSINVLSRGPDQMEKILA